jgi:hypothetical protein
MIFFGRKNSIACTLALKAKSQGRPEKSSLPVENYGGWKRISRQRGGWWSRGDLNP